MKIDHVIIVCNGCLSERRIDLDKPLASVEEVDVFLKTRPTQCSCGAPTCDVKLHLAPDEEPSG